MIRPFYWFGKAHPSSSSPEPQASRIACSPVLHLNREGGSYFLRASTIESCLVLPQARRRRHLGLVRRCFLTAWSCEPEQAWLPQGGCFFINTDEPDVSPLDNGSIATVVYEPSSSQFSSRRLLRAENGLAAGGCARLFPNKVSSRLCASNLRSLLNCVILIQSSF